MRTNVAGTGKRVNVRLEPLRHPRTSRRRDDGHVRGDPV